MSYSANDNQNFFVQNGRTTSRVVAQPGGQCSISLGGWTAEELERQRQQREQRESGLPPPPKKEVVVEPKAEVVVKEKENVVEIPKMESPETTVEKEAPPKEEASTANPAEQKPKAGVSSNAFASSKTTNSYNVLTDRPTSRVIMPPGGQSNLRLW